MTVISRDNYSAKFRNSDSVYYIGDNESLINTKCKVISCIPKAEAYHNIKVETIDGVRFDTSDNYILEKDYSIKGKVNPSLNFNIWDTIYYIGKDHPVLKKDTPYKIKTGRNGWNEKTRSAGKMIVVDNKEFNIDEEPLCYDFVSEKEQLELKGNSQKEKKNNFKAGDIVYYNYPDDSFNHHTSFLLWVNKSSDKLFDIYINKKNTPISKDFINKRFISEEDYKNKYGVTRKPETVQVSNYDTFIRGIKTGDIVYYMGNKITRLQNNVPYNVEFINPLTGLIKIEGGLSPSDDFVLADDYERIKLNDNLTSGDKGKPQSDIEIKMITLNETNEGKMKWFAPYASQDNWYRSTIKLDNPPNAYLRYDLLIGKMDGKWVMRIYYHRNKPSIEAKNNGVQIKEFKESQLLKNIVEFIKIQIEEEKKENLSFQDTD